MCLKLIPTRKHSHRGNRATRWMGWLRSFSPWPPQCLWNGPMNRGIMGDGCARASTMESLSPMLSYPLLLLNTWPTQRPTLSSQERPSFTKFIPPLSDKLSESLSLSHEKNRDSLFLNWHLLQTWVLPSLSIAPLPALSSESLGSLTYCQEIPQIVPQNKKMHLLWKSYDNRYMKPVLPWNIRLSRMMKCPTTLRDG